MKKIRITVMRMASYPDLSAAYENPLEHACDMQLGQMFIADGGRPPAGGDVRQRLVQHLALRDDAGLRRERYL